MIFSVVPTDELRRSALEVFTEALKRLAVQPKHHRAEDYINLDLFWITQQVRVDFKAQQRPIFPFVIVPDANNQPELDDDARSMRLKKRPDFTCLATDDQATDPNCFQIKFYLECKRLGDREGSWVLNDNYSKHGIDRFAHPAWGYGKGCDCATMIGYMQNMPPDTVLAEVNSHLPTRGFPNIIANPAGWASREVTELTQDPVTRHFDPSPIRLNHLWVDLRHCQFPPRKRKAKPPSPPSPTTPAKKKSSKAVKSAAAKTPTTKKASKKPGAP